MSLNRTEQMVFDYVQSHPEERHYWLGKVQKTATAAADEPAAVARIGVELWRYFEERSAVVEPFRSEVRRAGIKRTSMKNLAEHWLRLWVEPRPQRRATGGPSDRGAPE